MSTKKFVIKNAVKIIIFTIISIVVMTLISSPAISNNIAMGQMENSNELFILMETYSKMKPVVSAIYSIVVIYFSTTIGYDVYKFIKNKMNKENNNYEEV